MTPLSGVGGEWLVWWGGLVVGAVAPTTCLAGRFLATVFVEPRAVALPRATGKVVSGL